MWEADNEMQTNDIFNHLLSSGPAGREVNDDQLNNIHPARAAHLTNTTTGTQAGLLIRSGATQQDSLTATEITVARIRELELELWFRFFRVSLVPKKACKYIIK